MIESFKKTKAVQRDLSWIQSELMKVKDSDLITAIKNLLQSLNKDEKLDWVSLLSQE